MNITVVLPDIRSAHNIGSIFRTSDAVGVSSIILCGHSPCPVDKFDRPQKEIAKTALGAEKDIPWVYINNTKKAISYLKKENYKIIAVEQNVRSVNYKSFFKEISKSIKSLKENIKIAIIFGNEVDGVDLKILELCDHVIDIPMKGNKESLNVAVSAGIILYEAMS